jgi:hypothetical protein
MERSGAGGTAAMAKKADALTMTQFAKKLRGILEKAGKLDGPTGDTLLAESQSQKRPFTEVLVKKGVATEASWSR